MKDAVNWHVYDIADEDHSKDHDFRDPRPLETLEEVAVPGYDEQGNSLSNPLPPFHPRLSQFDAQIWEMCDVVPSKILMPHQNSSSTPYHYQIRLIMNQAKVNPKQAEIISEVGMALNATAQIMREFCKQAKADFRTFLCQMTPLVDGITEVEESWERPWMPEIPISIKVNKGAMQALYQMLPDPENDEHEIKEKENSSTIGYHVLEDFSRFNAMRRDLWRWYKEMDNIPDGTYDRIQALSNDDLESEWYKRFNWYRRQGPEFIELLIEVRRGDRAKIGVLANDVMEDRVKLSRIQRTVFFTEFSIRKNYLERNINPVVSRMIERIYNANGRLGFIGRQLHGIQNKEVPFKYTLHKWEWDRIWSAYFLEKEIKESRSEVRKLEQELIILRGKGVRQPRHSES